MANQRQTTVWVDAGGRTTATLITTSAGAAPVVGALKAHSNADVQSSWQGALTVTAHPAPTAAPYQDVTDRALLFFDAADGTDVSISLPAPVASIFRADGLTVDPAQIPDVIAAVIANVVTASGASVTSFRAGLRQRGPYGGLGG